MLKVKCLAIGAENGVAEFDSEMGEVKQILTHGRLDKTLDVLSVEATEHSLTYIRANFTNIPMARSATSVRWYGDDARFIVANL